MFFGCPAIKTNPCPPVGDPIPDPSGYARSVPCRYLFSAATHLFFAAFPCECINKLKINILMCVYLYEWTLTKKY